VDGAVVTVGSSEGVDSSEGRGAVGVVDRLSVRCASSSEPHPTMMSTATPRAMRLAWVKRPRRLPIKDGAESTDAREAMDTR